MPALPCSQVQFPGTVPLHHITACQSKTWDPCLTNQTGGYPIGQGHLHTWPPTDRHTLRSSCLAHSRPQERRRAGRLDISRPLAHCRMRSVDVAKDCSDWAKIELLMLRPTDREIPQESYTMLHCAHSCSSRSWTSAQQTSAICTSCPETSVRGAFI
ncbi:hypothetical protein CONLIGDRAFT_342179 [Coniochaeta ligniaria NRRL 30616]|uniref:Uncharacterized protein n=1 Tax=Coniochaeta ligniaria NRRL 30616 TaxID=1408157 RepID=A0A1J7IQF3_9PEZI|nr:hypothetical protein CONLIGDRAFT_342179 [Coniochaeta ligniaria NRRL 30616]